KIPIKGMGYKGPFAGQGWDSIWTDMSEIVRPTRDGVYGREYISTLVDVGSKSRFVNLADQESNPSSRTVEIPLPIVFDHLPSNLNSKSIMNSIAGAAARTGTMFIATPDQAGQWLGRKFDESFIPLISTSNLEDYREAIRRARFIELTSCEPPMID